MNDFNDFILQAGLIDCGFIGSIFTWSNNTVWCRLNKALVNAKWQDIVPSTEVLHLAIDDSDHAPLLVNCGLFHRVFPTQFKFMEL